MVKKIQQTRKELLVHLNENLDFLKRSAAAFDSGYTAEAKRLAVTIRVLVHDTDKSKSILNLLKVKSNMGFLDTASDYQPKNLMSHHGLVGISVGGDKGGSFFAPLDDLSPARLNKYVRFTKWWNKYVIVDSNKNKFDRSKLVLTLANKDGGAHVDPKLTDDYVKLTRNNSIGWKFSDGKTEAPILEVELFSVRQIAHELIKSIERQGLYPFSFQLSPNPTDRI